MNAGEHDEPPELIGNVRLDGGPIDNVGSWDQRHAQALDLLRTGREYVLLVAMPTPLGLHAIATAHMVGADDRDRLLAFAHSLEIEAEHLRELADAMGGT